MKIYTIPKKGYAEKQAAIVVRYGGADYIHIMPDGSKMEMPMGIAHFLEHKLFEDPELNIFEAFTQHGASANAYTHFTHTAYYFNTIDHFQENLGLLFRLVQTPHFTDGNVEKEKGIILAEIDMYADNPYWQVYTGLHKALFSASPLRRDILGTRESVQSIQSSQLYDCYNHFYTPENMALICVGDLDQDQVQGWAEGYLDASTHDNLSRAARSFRGDEPPQAAASVIEKQMSVSIPLFQLGFKVLYNETPNPAVTAASHILADMIAGESSEVYAELYDNGMIDNQFSTEYIGGAYYGIFIFSGVSPQPEAVRSRILHTLDSLRKNGLSKGRFETIKSKHIGRFIRGLNSIDNVSSIQAEIFTKGQDIPALTEAFRQVSLEDAEAQLRACLREDNYALSVIRP